MTILANYDIKFLSIYSKLLTALYLIAPTDKYCPDSGSVRLFHHKYNIMVRIHKYRYIFWSTNMLEKLIVSREVSIKRPE